MNKLILVTALCLITTVGIFSACDSSAKKEETAKAEVQSANNDLRLAQEKARAEEVKLKQEEEWKTYKTASDAEIALYDAKLAEYKASMKQRARRNGAEYDRRVVELEKQNSALKERMTNYDKNHSDWDAFKREFSHDMNELGQSLKDFTVDNKK